MLCRDAGPVCAGLHAEAVVSLQVSGWLYFLTWSLSFYPQFLLNWRTKSVVGLSFDYVSLNLLGFVCYTIFNVAFYWNDAVQQEYR